MAQTITDYAAFFAGAKQAVRDLGQLRENETELVEKKKGLESQLQAKQKMAADTVSRTLKARAAEVSGSYDAEIEKVQDRLKRLRTKREKAKNQGIKERIAEDTLSLVKENEELRAKMKTVFRTGGVPGFCRSTLYYSLYFTKGIAEAGIFLLTVLICFLAVPCGIYLLIPERKTWYLFLIYFLAVLLFGGLYVLVGNRTKLRKQDVLQEGRKIRDSIRHNRKQIRVIAKSIQKDKNEAIYNLQKFDDEIAQMEQDLSETEGKKKDALNTFETVTKTIISDEIMGTYKQDLDQLNADLELTDGDLRTVRARMKEQSLFITDTYEVYLGKEMMTEERLQALETIIENGQASNISEALSVYKSGEYQQLSTQ